MCIRDRLEAVRPVLVSLSGTVHSQRLDAVISFLTRLSRDKAQELIHQELVKVDGQIRTDVALSLIHIFCARKLFFRWAGFLIWIA